MFGRVRLHDSRVYKALYDSCASIIWSPHYRSDDIAFETFELLVYKIFMLIYAFYSKWGMVVLTIPIYMSSYDLISNLEPITLLSVIVNLVLSWLQSDEHNAEYFSWFNRLLIAIKLVIFCWFILFLLSCC